ncbi:hypothetical protein HDU83_002335 [Entophlyctis luteolus]|nr:hypothetical protein HDU82_005510 [Entophlyctis luteolus]KAJ3347175.1 hypothetical protein HDU83_002335 [Entophlyctis luteolus]KAJ3388626.1 hypothetical protein HDU84_009632 [Entophlyctis sp. JEL0112]
MGLAPARSTASLVRAFKGGDVPALRVRPNSAKHAQSNTATSSAIVGNDDMGSDDHLDHNDPHLAVLARHDSLHIETRPHVSQFALLRRTFSGFDSTHDQTNDLDFEVHHFDNQEQFPDPGESKQRAGKIAATNAAHKSKVLDVFLKLRSDIHKLAQTYKKPVNERQQSDLDGANVDHDQGNEQNQRAAAAHVDNQSHSPPPQYQVTEGDNNNAFVSEHASIESPPETVSTVVSSGQSAPSFQSSALRSLPARSSKEDAAVSPELPSGENAETITAEEESYRKLKEYKYIKLLGAGAQGTVTLRLHLPTSSIRALKSIPTAPSAVDSNVRESFRREVEILTASRRHPSIIRLIDSWESISTVYQVFDVMNGGDASMDGVFSHIGEEKAVCLIAPIADALRFLHKNSILHRDVRPANIFLRRSITGHELPRELETIPVLADFGIANFVRNSGRLAAPFPVTPAHIAPEILIGARFTKASDCYGLGYYSLHLLLRKQLTISDVRDTSSIDDRHWLRLSTAAKMSISMLLCSDPGMRLTAEEFCNGEWVSNHRVECVKHIL